MASNMSGCILAIESSCDESAAAVISADGHVLSNVIHSQIDIHAEFGGVVPEVASRHHIHHVPEVAHEAIVQAGISFQNICCVASTIGPGLIGPLLVGSGYAKGLAISLGCDFLPVHHLEGHLWAACVDRNGQRARAWDGPPFLALIVSGGHTALYDYRGIGDIEILGETRDDAAGEAFDKSAKLMGLGYPGGVRISQLAEHGDANRFDFPIGLRQKNNLEFSFSGLKNAVRLAIEKHVSQKGELDYQLACDIAASLEKRIVDALILKTKNALKQTKRQTLVLGGGVVANRRLRHEMQQLAQKKGIMLKLPQPGFITDNAAMIGLAAHAYYRRGYRGQLSAKAAAWMPLDADRQSHFRVTT